MSTVQPGSEPPGDTVGPTVLRMMLGHQRELADVVYIEHLTSALYLDHRDDVDHYMEIMNRLSAEALTPARTAGFLTEITREI